MASTLALVSDSPGTQALIVVAPGATNTLTGITLTDVQIAQQFVAALAGTSTLTAAVTPYQRFVAALAGHASVTATVTPYQRFTAALAGAASLTANVLAARLIVAALTGTSSLTADVYPYRLTPGGSSSDESPYGLTASTMSPGDGFAGSMAGAAGTIGTR